MSKISGVLGAGPRVTGADLSQSHTQRRGAPLLPGMRESDPSPRLAASTMSAFDRLKARDLVEGPKARLPLSPQQMEIRQEVNQLLADKGVANTQMDKPFFVESTTEVAKEPKIESAAKTQELPMIVDPYKGQNLSIEA